MTFKIFYLAHTNQTPLAVLDAATAKAAIKQYRADKPYPIPESLIAVIVLH